MTEQPIDHGKRLNSDLIPLDTMRQLGKNSGVYFCDISHHTVAEVENPWYWTGRQHDKKLTGPNVLVLCFCTDGVVLLVLRRTIDQANRENVAVIRISGGMWDDASRVNTS